MRSVVIPLLVLVSLACGRTSTESEPESVFADPATSSSQASTSDEPSTTPPVVAELEPRAEPSPEPRAEPAVEPLILGWAEQWEPFAEDALERERAGSLLHQSGDYAGARAAFAEAVAADPSYGLARYELACALSRLGKQELAAAEIEPLLRDDLPVYGPYLDSDEDLAGLRDSAAGRELARRRELIQAAWLTAANEGIVARSSRPRGRERGMGLGVYLPSSGRFIPLAPPITGGLVGMVDREAQRVLIISGNVITGDVWVVQPDDIGVHLFDLAEPGKVLTQLEHVERKREILRELRRAVHAAIEGDNVILTYKSVGYASDHDVSVRVSETTVQILAESDELMWGSEYHISRAQRHVEAHGHGATVVEPAPSQAAAELARTLMDRPERVEQSADGRFVMLLAQASYCDGEEGQSEEHRLVRHDRRTGETTELSAGSSKIGAALGADGTVYLDQGDGRPLGRFPVGASEPVWDGPNWIRLRESSWDNDC